MTEGMTCYERDEDLCEDQMCLRTGCRLRNQRLSGLPAQEEPVSDGVFDLQQRIEGLELLHHNELLRCQAAEREIERLTRLLNADRAERQPDKEVVLEEAEKLDGTIMQTVRREDGTEYVRPRCTTMLEFMIQAGYDASLPHPQGFKNFDYLKLADIMNVPLVRPSPAEKDLQEQIRRKNEWADKAAALEDEVARLRAQLSSQPETVSEEDLAKAMREIERDNGHCGDGDTFVSYQPTAAALLSKFDVRRRK